MRYVKYVILDVFFTKNFKKSKLLQHGFYFLILRVVK